MYNGIGLTTPRGSGTSGHVVRNLSALKPGQGEHRNKNNRARDFDDPGQSRREKPIDAGILEHEKRRQVEVHCLELQDKLESRNDLSEGEIEKRVDDFRQKLLDNINSLPLAESHNSKSFESHRRAQLKDQENSHLANALDIDDQQHVEGAAFDRELQELRRRKRQLEREEKLEREERNRRRRRDRSSSRSREKRRRHHRSRSPYSSDRDHSTDRDSTNSSSDGSYRSRSRHHHRSSRRKPHHDDHRSSRSHRYTKRSRSPYERSHSSRKNRRPKAGEEEERGDEERKSPSPSVPAREVDGGEPGEIEEICQDESEMQSKPATVIADVVTDTNPTPEVAGSETEQNNDLRSSDKGSEDEED